MVVGLCQWVWSSPFSCRWFGFAGWNWQHIMVHRVCVSIIPLWPWGTMSFGAVSGLGTYVRTPSCRCSMYLTEWSVRSSEDVFRSVEEMECSNGFDMWAAMVRSDESAFWRVRRSSAANWGGMAMRERAGVCAPVACWRRVTAATVWVGWEGMKCPGLFMWCTCCGEGIGLVIWGAGVWEETFRKSELIWCSSEEWQVTKTALSGTWEVSSAVFVGRCCDLEY